MKKFFQWVYANKVTLTGFFALVLFILDEIFKFTKDMNISQEAYYTVASAIILFIGYAIKGRGLESIDEYKAAVEKARKLKEEKSLTKTVEELKDLLINDNEEEKPEEKTPPKEE